MSQSVLRSLGRAAAATLLALAFNAAAQPAAPVGAITPESFKKQKAAPFDLTGTWQHDGRAQHLEVRAREVQAHAGSAGALRCRQEGARATGKVYRDDIGQCWPAGMPLIMTRVWPIAMIQLPTAIYMVSGFENACGSSTSTAGRTAIRTTSCASFNGESIGHWEGDTLVVDTKYFPGHHHWMDQGGASIPASDAAAHRRADEASSRTARRCEIEYTMTDPKNWKGEWMFTKRFNRLDDTDITEVECMPDLNENLPATSSQSLVK